MDYKIFIDLLLEQKKEVEKKCRQEFDLNLLVVEKSADVLDQATSDQQQTLNSKFINRKKFYLDKINKALIKIENKEYGICDDCGGDISDKRLLARPTALLCIDCKSDQELKEKANQRKGGMISLWEELD